MIGESSFAASLMDKRIIEFTVYEVTLKLHNGYCDVLEYGGMRNYDWIILACCR